MLFTTLVFVLLFLPIVLIGFFGIGARSQLGAASWLFFASLVFYGYWMPELTTLLLGSICVNFWIGKTIAGLSPKVSAGGSTGSTAAKQWVIFGIAANLSLLAYFKYANFFVGNFNTVLSMHWNIGHIALPIGISFFTFTQIAFLADAYQKGTKELNFFHYGLFVTYFPHLIAGPVLHHAQMMPQFRDEKTYTFNGANFVAGLTIFAIGLIKKIVLADGISPYADAIFKPADAGLSPDLLEAWLGALAYTLQLYFDFSGYSDMAIGLSWMFNIRLPFNFDSPYRATNISDFWRRWHISLSNFLRDYLYIAMGGNQHGAARRYSNLMVTMILGGLWHGASWSFVIWGLLHGLYLWMNHGFRALCGAPMYARLAKSRVYSVMSWALTMVAVVGAWVLFRAETLAGAMRMLTSMIDFHNPYRAGVEIHPLLWDVGLTWSRGMGWCAALAVIAVLPMNSNRIGKHVLLLCQTKANVLALIGGASVTAVLWLVFVNVSRNAVSAFIYFNF